MLLNFHEAAIVSGIAVACALGAEYPFADHEDAVRLYERLGGVLLGKRFRRVS
jgi:hypothetical protein